MEFIATGDCRIVMILERVPHITALLRRVLAGDALHATGVFRLLHRVMLPRKMSVLAYHGLTRAALPVPHPSFVRVDRLARHMEVPSAAFRRC
jgi:hypothetical protein